MFFYQEFNKFQNILFVFKYKYGRHLITSFDLPRQYCRETDINKAIYQARHACMYSLHKPAWYNFIFNNNRFFPPPISGWFLYGPENNIFRPIYNVFSFGTFNISCCPELVLFKPIYVVSRPIDVINGKICRFYNILGLI